MTLKSCRLPLLSAGMLPAALFLSSCNSASHVVTTPQHTVVTGRAMGGEQPISAATIQLYAVGTATDGGAATPLIAATVTTSDGTGLANSNANDGNNNNQFLPGYFTITGDYTCPSATAQVYLAAIGGNPGAGTNTSQENLVALGDCGNLSASTNLVVNEITTVGTVRALSGYITGYASVGSTPAHAAALSTAFNTASQYINATYGSAPGPNLPAGMNASDNELRALANVVQTCVNSTGGTASDGSACGRLFALSKPAASAAPTDTVGALIDIFLNPTQNVTALFNLQPSTPAFAPTNTSAPPDWSLPILTVPGTPTFSVATGNYSTAQTITISDSDATAVLYYTVDGSTPTASSTKYITPISVGTNGSTTLQAIAIESARLTSAAGTATYTLSGLAAPTVAVSAVTANVGDTTGQTITATSNANGSVVTFSVTSPADGTFSPTTCTVAAGTCSVTYQPSGTLAAATYSNAITASFTGSGSYAAASASATLTINAAAPTFSLLHSLQGPSDGANPYNAPIQGTDGNFYGTTYLGGATNLGSVYKMTPAGVVTLIHSFSATATDGERPQAGLIQGTDGNFYGTTVNSVAGSGTVFQITPSGTFTLLYTFSGSATDGGSPLGALIQSTDGSFYGTTTQNGPGGGGTLYKITSAGSFTLLHSFVLASEGGQPHGLIQGTDGNFYGCTYAGGSNSDGTLYQMTPSGTLTVLHTFSGSADGNECNGALVQGPDGNFYGTALVGGANLRGSVYKITSSGVFTLLHSFALGTTDGLYPYSGLTPGADGNLYGTTNSGGANNVGIVYKITIAGAFTLLHSFSGTADGASPQAGLTLGVDGNFYGAVYGGGASNVGTIFQISSMGTFNLLHTFSSARTDGNNPLSPLIQAADGNFYGTTSTGGANTAGVVFKMTPAGTPSILHSFSTPATGSTDGSRPYFGGVVQGTDGSFYGTTYLGGSANFGTVYKITPAGTFTLLHSFTGTTTDGQTPYAGLVQGTDGNFYGTTNLGGANTSGIVYKITPGGTFSLLHSFSTATTDGRNPYAGLVQGADGNFYGTTLNGGASAFGTVYKITPSGTFSLLHSFSNAPTDGRNPYAGLVQGTDGNFYGTTYTGGANANGSIFKITPAGTFTLLHSFSSATTDGNVPYAALVQGADGNFYGTTYVGGLSSAGTVYSISPSGTFTLLHSFSSATTDGKTPYASLIQGSDGSFYGTTYVGGANTFGSLYKLASAGYSAPVTISAPATVAAGGTFTLSYAVSNASSTTLQSCQYFTTNSSGTITTSGALTGSPTTQTATLSAPAAPGTYILALTCGGTETSTQTLTVQ